MEVIKIRLGKGLADMRDEMEHMVDEMLHLSRSFAPAGVCWSPPMDVYETGDEVIILMEMAGLNQDEIQVVVDRGVLKVSGHRRNPFQDKERRVRQMEIDFGVFRRLVRIGAAVPIEKIRATYREGFLTINIPKT
jgi:HSP20 family protein